MLQHRSAMDFRDKLQAAAGFIDRLERHPDADFLVALGMISAKRFVLMPRRWRADQRRLQNRVFKRAARLGAEKFSCDFECILAKNRFLQFWGEKNGVDDLR